MSVINVILDIAEKYSPYIVGGSIGAVINRLRTKMSFKDFIASLLISIFVSVSVGIVCKDYFNIEEQNLIFVFCGMSGTFSKIILDEIQEIIGSASEIVKKKFNIDSDLEED